MPSEAGSVRTRPARPADVAAIAELYRPYVTGSVVSFETVPPTAETIGTRMCSGMPWYVATSDQVVLGYALSSPHRERAAYRWPVYIAQGAQRQGLGRLLYTRLLGVLTDLGHVRAHAGITMPNAASVALHEAMGFQNVVRYPQVGWWRSSSIRDSTR